MSNRLKTMTGRAGGRPLRRNAALGHELANGPHSQDCACVNCRLSARVDQAAAAELQRILRGEQDDDDLPAVTGNAGAYVPPRVLLAGQRQLPPLTQAERAALSGQDSRAVTGEIAYTPPAVVLARRPGRGRGAA